MKAGSTFSTEYNTLYDMAVFSYTLLDRFLAENPRTREVQKTVVLQLAEAFSGKGYFLSKDFLKTEVLLKDNSLLENWSSTPMQLAWLMAHEELSNFFVRFVLQYWNPEHFLVHHVPKAAGTSVGELLNDIGWFMFSPQNEFAVMAESHGIIGFSQQVVLFDRKYKNDRIYIGGHYNLPDTVKKTKIFGRCQGVTLCRAPLDILSSALRFVWTRIERDDPGIKERHGITDVSGKDLKWLRESVDNSTIAAQHAQVIFDKILKSQQFLSEYEEIFVKYYYNHEITSPELLIEYISDVGDIYTSLDMRHDKDAVLAALKISGTLPHSNVSTFVESDLFRIFGGKAEFYTAISPLIKESSRIYAALLDNKATLFVS